MNWFFAHLLFTLVWASLLGAYDLLTLLSGFLLGLGLFRLTLNKPSMLYRRLVYRFVRFSAGYLRDILMSNLRIAFDILRGRPAIQPGILALDVSALSPRATVVVANLITMTPGTVSLDVDPENHLLFVHCLYLQNPTETRESLQRDYVASIAHLQKPASAEKT
ncbi:MAG: Na+/H+ antiporter subunit E [Opitutales bacterium]